MEVNKSEDFTETGIHVFDLRVGFVNNKTTLWKLSPEEELSLLQLLSHPKTRMRWNAADHIGKRKIKEGVDPLILALQDSQWLVRLHAAKALGRIGDLKAIDSLIHCLTDENPYVVRRVIASLVSFDEAHVFQHVLKSIQTDSSISEIIMPVLQYFISYDAALLLIQTVHTNTKTWMSGTIYHKMKGITPLILSHLNKALGEEKIKFLHSLKNYGDERAIQPIVGIIQTTQNEAICSSAYEAIQHIQCRKYEKYLP
jgi:HEAT repeat protein